MNHLKKAKEILPETKVLTKTNGATVPAESKEVLSQLAGITITPVVVCSTEHKITWINEAFTRLMGYTLEEAVGCSQAEFLSGISNYDAHLQKIYDKLSQGSSYRFQFLCKTKYGELFWNDLFIQPVYDDAGEIIRYFTTYRDITEKVKLEEALIKEQEEKERKVTEQVILAQERERTIISRELHDNVNQVLTAVKLQLETAKEMYVPAQSILDRSVIFLNNSINEIRKLSKMLSAPTLGSATLADCIQDLCDELAKQNKLEIIIEAGTYKKRLATDKELAIYRIFQEQFENVIKHAGAKKVHIFLSQNKNQVRFALHDDGKGFDMNASRNGIGINNIISRVKVLGGKLNIDTAPGKGCKMEVLFTV